jgi:hypothetical protein
LRKFLGETGAECALSRRERARAPSGTTARLKERTCSGSIGGECPCTFGEYFPYAISPLEIHTSEIEGRVVLSNVLLEFEVHLESIVTIQIAAGTGI